MHESHLLLGSFLISCHYLLDQFSSVTQLCPTLQPHGLQRARPPCPSPIPGLYSNSCPLSWWCYPTISSSVIPFSSCLQSFPASGSFPMSQFKSINSWVLSLLYGPILTSIHDYWKNHCFDYIEISMNVKVTQSCPTLWKPMDWGLPGSSVHGILQARILEWVAIPFSRGSSRLEMEPRFPALQADSLPSEPPGKPQKHQQKVANGELPRYTNVGTCLLLFLLLYHKTHSP